MKTDQSIEKKTIVAMEQHYSGPLPPAQEFKAYGEVEKTAPSRIIALTENEQEQRHKQQDFILKTKSRDNLIGAILGTVCVLVCLICAFILGMNGHDWLASSFVAISASLVAIFVLRKTPEKK